MIIGCDLDGTICDNLPLLVDALNRYTGQKILPDNIPEYDVCKVYKITREEFNQLMSQVELNMIEGSPLIPGADKYLRLLAAAKHQINIITARSPIYEEATRRWLNRHNLPYRGLYLLNSHDKVDICKQLGVDLVVEDNYHNAVQLSKAGFDVILFDAPHNLNWPWEGRRCGRWEEVYRYIDSVNNGE
ncbi:5' nucleotidase, NT5C type [Desulfofalx alkaliphila]|uniref:5' nucleotidase, NT5C type n=1 Tax=Desulfofalx alkaliphila TaxID=105483 RepID=UPI0004E1000B|nr:hypothetical protein [Desulfofalx alkaliphila]